MNAASVSESNAADKPQAAGELASLDADELKDLYRPSEEAEGEASNPAEEAPAGAGAEASAPAAEAAAAVAESSVLSAAAVSAAESAAVSAAAADAPVEALPEELAARPSQRLSAAPRRHADARGVYGTRRRLQIGAVLAVLLAAGASVIGLGKSPHRGPEVLRFKLSDPAAAAAQSAPPAAVAWERLLSEVEELRLVMAAKRAEVEQAVRACRFGVLENEEDLAGLVRRTGYGTLSQALKDRRVEFVMQSLLRRQAYIDLMEQPLDRLEAAAEELLYLRRRAAIDLELKEVSDRVELDEIHRRIREIMAAAPALLRDLSREVEGAEAETKAEVYWKRALESARAAAAPSSDGSQEAIVEEICMGDLGRAAQLSRVSLRAARCLAESSARDLVLPAVTEISASAAMRLSDWPGEWLCLNGLRRLSPEAARHLFAWPGVRLSLNGLRELPAEAARFLLGWEGRHLELMGLETTAGLNHLAQWEQAGGTLYIGEKLRREIQNLKNPAGRPQAGRR